MSEHKSPLSERRAGVLLPVSALPSHYGIGDFGPGAYAFVDFLHQAGQRYWQILPLTPTSGALGNSPYSSFSAFAGNPLFISPELLIEEGFIKQEETSLLESLPEHTVDYEKLNVYKTDFLFKVFYNKRYEIQESVEFQDFCQQQAHWLDAYSLYVALKERFNEDGWSVWPDEIRYYAKLNRHVSEELSTQILREKMLQYLFFKQWKDLKEYANDKGVLIVGDLPIYVNYDSADVWSSPRDFQLDDKLCMRHVAGVPPDYFSETGQLWGNPLYDWEQLQSTGYDFWMRRLRHALRMYDVIRIDHFRGLVAYWKVPAQERTAINGHWEQAPVRDFLNHIKDAFPTMPIIAEDLGTITDDVRQVIQDYQLPGMKVLMFAFGDDDQNPYLPHNIDHCAVVYTGTHDNNTVKGWFNHDMNDHERHNLKRYIPHELRDDNVAYELMQMAYHTMANTAIIPLQDVLGLGADARMNTPATVDQNWQWRLQRDQLSFVVAQELKQAADSSGRFSPCLNPTG